MSNPMQNVTPSEEIRILRERLSEVLMATLFVDDANHWIDHNDPAWELRAVPTMISHAKSGGHSYDAAGVYLAAITDLRNLKSRTPAN